MSKVSKRKLLEALSESLSQFRPDLTDYFMCPICLDEIPLSKPSKISKAHIFPKYAKGNLLTFLCTRCNSQFGSRQDKWFGEYLHIKENKLHPLQSNKMPSHFMFNNIKVNGVFQYPKDGNLEFTIAESKNSPKTRKLIEQELYKKNMTFSITCPLTKNQTLISIGLLTAAYLFWFKEFGYSWVFQRHLDVFRKQILHPKDNILPKGVFINSDTEAIEKPWIGVIDILGENIPVMRIYEHIVAFPPANNTNFFKVLNEEQKTKYHTINYAAFETGLFLSKEPAIVCYKTSAIIYPEIIKENNLNHIVIFFPGGNHPLQILRKVTKEQRESIAKKHTIHTTKIVFK